ncbi:hypothetical protein D3C78_851330 [compost metagenome]
MGGFCFGYQRRQARGQLLDARIQHGLSVRQARFGNLLPGNALDDLQHAALTRGDQQQCTAFATGTAGTADTVHVGLRVVRHVHVEHVGDARYVQTAGSDVSGDDDVQAAILERVDDALTLVLGDVAVQRSSLVAFGFQGGGQVQGGLLGTHEGDQRVELFHFQQTQHSRDLLVGVDHQVGLLDRGNGLGLGLDLDVLGFTQVTFGDRADRRRQGSGEQYSLTAGRDCIEDHFEVIHEAQLQHFVGFVQYQVLHGGQDFLVATQVVAQTARGGHDDLRAVANGTQLWAHRGTTVYSHHVNARHLLGVGFESGGYLQRQLTGWRQDQGLRFALAHIDLVEDRQGEGSGLAGASLRLADHVVTGEDDRDRLLLNGGRLFVAGRQNGSNNIRIEIESGEAAGFLGHGSASRCIRKDPCSKAAQAMKDRQVTQAALAAGICEND